MSTGAVPSISRLERFASLDSTQRVVRAWLAAGTPEICVAVADEQTAGRGRAGRSWVAPSGAALLLSVGLRPSGLAIGHAWRLGAIVALAMLDAAEANGLREGQLCFKWPNDLVADGADGLPRKLAGVLGETALEPGGTIASAVVGIGVNVTWPRDRFPRELAATMTSLHEVAGRPVDREALLEDFLARLEPRYAALRTGQFDAAGWAQRQRTTGAQVDVAAEGHRLTGIGRGVDPESGALLLDVDGQVRTIENGEVTSCRVARSGV